MNASSHHSSSPTCAASLLLLLTMGIAQAGEQRIACPANVEAEAVRLATPAGWTAYMPNRFWLHWAGPMDGPPSDMAVLKESSSVKRSGNKVIVRWPMAGEFAVGKWMACNYGEANDVILSMKIDERASECAVTSTKRAFGRIDIDIRCTW